MQFTVVGPTSGTHLLFASVAVDCPWQRKFLQVGQKWV